jgi:transposase, IS605 orfB family
MLRGMKIALDLTDEQEQQMWKSVGVARWVYNYAITRNKQHYQEYLDGKTSTKSLSGGTIQKELVVLKNATHPWLKEVGCNVIKRAVKDWEDAHSRFFKGLCKAPKYKSKNTSKPSFYVNYESLRRVSGGFRGERLGFIKTREPLPKIPKGTHYKNPRISFDGKHWCLSLAYEVPAISVDLTDLVIGVDLGIKTLATLSTGELVENINKSHRVKQLEKQLRREQRHLARQLQANTKGYLTTEKGGRKPIYKRSLELCSNIQETKRKIKLLYRKLSSIRLNYVHQLTSYLVKQLPKGIVIEDLNVSGMLKNKHLAKHVKDAMFYEIRRQLEYKCLQYGIQLVIADRFYPSSKTCSYCGGIKSDLKLKDRVYKCSSCGLEKDRDLNAAENLAYYFYRG